MQNIIFLISYIFAMAHGKELQFSYLEDKEVGLIEKMKQALPLIIWNKEDLPDIQQDEDEQTKRRLKRGSSSRSSSSRSYSAPSSKARSTYKPSSNIRSYKPSSSVNTYKPKTKTYTKTSTKYYKKYTTTKNTVSYSNSYFSGGRSY
jgi:hypothetical protein